MTFQVTVDGTEQVLDNTATVTTAEAGTTTTNTVSHAVDVMTVTKSASPGDGSNVLQGETITYSVDVENIGGAPLTYLAVSDTLPSGVTYVGGSAAITGARQLVQYRDEFETVTYAEQRWHHELELGAVGRDG